MTFFELWVTGNGYAKFMGGYSNPEYDEMIEKRRRQPGRCRAHGAVRQG